MDWIQLKAMQLVFSQYCFNVFLLWLNLAHFKWKANSSCMRKWQEFSSLATWLCLHLCHFVVGAIAKPLFWGINRNCGALYYNDGFQLDFFLLFQEVIPGLPASLAVFLQNVLRESTRSRGQQHKIAGRWSIHLRAAEIDACPSSLQVSRIADSEESVMLMLGRCLPHIVPNVLLAKREVILPPTVSTAPLRFSFSPPCFRSVTCILS